MALADRIVRSLGGTTAADVRAMIAASTRDAVPDAARSLSGQAFAAGIEEALRTRGLQQYRQAAFSNHALTYSALTLRAEAVAAVPLKLARREPDGTRTILDSDPALELLDNPFPALYSDGGHFLEMLVLYLLATGNVWLMPDEAMHSRTKLPLSLCVFGLRQVQPVIDAHSWRLLAWTFQFGAEPRTVAPETFRHLKLANPDHGPQILGLGPLQAAQTLLDGDFARDRYTASFFTNGAAPGLKMSYKPDLDLVQKANLPAQLTKDQMDAVKERFNDDYTGADKAHKTAFLNSGWMLEALGMSQRDMDFVAQEQMTVRKLGFVLRTPSVLMNDRDGGGLSHDEVEAAEALLARWSTIPLCRKIERFLTRAIIKPYNPQLELYFDTDEIEALQTKFDQKVKNYVQLAQNGISPRAAAALVDLGLDPDELPDEALVPFSLVPSSQVYNVSAEGETDDGPAPARVLYGVRRAAPPATRQPPTRLARWRALVDTYTPIEKSYRLAVRRHVFALRDETLGNLTRVLGARQIDDALLLQILFDPTAADEDIRRVSAPFFERAITTGAEGIATEVGAASTIGLDAPAARAALQLKEIRIVGINETIADAIREALSLGFDAGETLTGLSARVRQVFDASATRARTIARTEIAQGVNTGRFVEMAAQGIEEHEWLSSGDDHVRTPPADAFNHRIDGERRTIGEPFSIGLRHPSDPDGEAGNVINCRCATLPIAPGS